MLGWRHRETSYVLHNIAARLLRVHTYLEERQDDTEEREEEGSGLEATRLKRRARGGEQQQQHGHALCAPAARLHADILCRG